MSMLLESDFRKRYPPSPPCDCQICRSYCARPGWWTVGETERTLDRGYASRMMLEISPERDLVVLSPAFRGNEGRIALQEFSRSGCTFLSSDGCALFGQDIRPLECRFCHHDRRGRGAQCHHDLELQWRSPHARRLVQRWYELVRNARTAERSPYAPKGPFL